MYAERSQMERWCVVVSAIFLLFTAYRYCIRGYYRDLFGKSVINLCVSQAMGLLIFENMRDMPPYGSDYCIMRGSLAYYLMLVSFFWLNCICIQTVTANEIAADRLKHLTPKIIDYIVRSSIDQQTYENPKKRRYISYLVYAWGTPAVFCVLITILTMFAREFRSCGFLLSGLAEWIFMYGVMLVMTAINIYLFAIDAATLDVPSKLLSICNGENEVKSAKCSHKEQEPRSRPQQQEIDHFRRVPAAILHLLLKAFKYLMYRVVKCIRFHLFIVMTVPWLSSIMISLMPNCDTLGVIQVLNNLRGAWIFLVLVMLRTEEAEEEIKDTRYKNVYLLEIG